MVHSGEIPTLFHCRYQHYEVADHQESIWEVAAPNFLCSEKLIEVHINICIELQKHNKIVS